MKKALKIIIFLCGFLLGSVAMLFLLANIEFKQIIYKSNGSTNYYYKFEDDKFEKYLAFDSIMEEISRREYVLNEYDCKNFSEDMVQKLKDANIMAETIDGVKNGNDKIDHHRWVAVWIEPQRGNFITSEDEYSRRG